LHSRLLLEYDGGRFSGWSRQPGRRTVQEEVERALAVVLRDPSVSLTVAGRTDAGVHALAQVASYAGPPAGVTSLNALLPEDVAALGCDRAPDEFDARRDATSRAYLYRILARQGRPSLDRRRVLHWPHRIERDALERCAAAIVGTHDFTAFTPAETEHVRFSRRVLGSWWRESPEGMLDFFVEADAFMRHMNRVLVGTMLEVASGRRTLADFRALLEGRPRAAAGPTAPAHALYLLGIGYGGAPVLGREGAGAGSAKGLGREGAGYGGAPVLPSNSSASSP
jgi:tRNA pseudouridine38-40 synthase